MDGWASESKVTVSVTHPKRAILASLVLVPGLSAAQSIPTAAAAGFEWSSFLGPFHMVFLHLPIGFLALASAIEVWAAVRPFDGIRRLIGIVLGLSLVTGSLTAVLGLLRANGGEYSPETLLLHRNTGLGLVLLTALTWGLHGSSLKSGGGWLWGYRASMAATLLVLTVAGHQGGTLTHGRGFLSQYSPEPLRSLMESVESPKPVSVTGVAPGGAEVQRILAARCASCHGAEKQKGKFRVDQRESLLKGGDSGEPAVVPGDPAKSLLVRLILLPRGHDDVMPPEGKEPLTDAEVLAVLKWIQAGAD